MKKAFSLIELMVAISVLAIGIVLIARSFLFAAAALDTGENRIIAVDFLERKMGDIEEQALIDVEKIKDFQKDVAINGRKARFAISSEKIEADEIGDAMNKITLTASWMEGRRSYDEILVTYFENKKE